MDEAKTLSDCGLSSSIAKAQSPATIGLALRYFSFAKTSLFFLSLSITLYIFRSDDGEFEQLEMIPYSSPPELPYVMKNQETNGQDPPM